MKNQIIKCLKKTMAVVLTVSMLAGLSMVASAKLQEESDTDNDKITYSKYTTNECERYWGNSAPNENTFDDGTGKIFAGWFKYEGNKYIALTEKPASGDVYAKYVPAQMLGVKVQASRNTTLETSSTNMRILTGVDSLNYQSVGFKADVISLTENGKTFVGERSLGADKVVNNVYWKINAEGEEKSPADTFGTGAAKYFAATWVNGIDSDNYTTIICITPYIVTLDGVTVYGLTKYAHVEDCVGLENEYRWVNIPINVRDVKNTNGDSVGVAAGVLKIKKAGTDGESWDCVKVECGRLFQEMDYAIKDDESVKLVGNKSSMTENAYGNTIFANVRFKVSNEQGKTNLGGYLFEILEEDFANIDEEQFTDKEFPVWNIAY